MGDGLPWAHTVLGDFKAYEVYGMNKRLHTARVALEAEALENDAIPLSKREGFRMVAMDDGSFRVRREVDL